MNYIAKASMPKFLDVKALLVVSTSGPTQKVSQFSIGLMVLSESPITLHYRINVAHLIKVAQSQL